ISTTGVSSPSARNWRTMASTLRRLMPLARARSEARWMVGPSAMGSEKGTPSSMMSAPPATRARIRGRVNSGSGSPAVMKGIRALRPLAARLAKVVWILDMGNSAGQPKSPAESEGYAGALGHGVHVLVAPAGKIHQQQLFLGQGRRQARCVGQGMGGFQGRDDALQPAQVVEGLQRLGIGHRDVFGAAAVLEPGVLRADAGVVEAGGDGMGVDDL